MSAATEVLSQTEKLVLAACEADIKEDVERFMRVGNALMRIRDGRLYRESHETFEEYCQDKWNMSRQYVNKLIAAKVVVDQMETIVSIDPPKNETQTRPLAELETPEEQAEAWEEAVATAPRDSDGEPVVTGKHVKAVVAKKLGKPAPWMSEADKHVDLALRLYEKHAELCDESTRMIALLEESQKQHVKYVKATEAN